MACGSQLDTYQELHFTTTPVVDLLLNGLHGNIKAASLPAGRLLPGSCVLHQCQLLVGKLSQKRVQDRQALRPDGLQHLQVWPDCVAVGSRDGPHCPCHSVGLTDSTQAHCVLLLPCRHSCNYTAE